MNPDVQVVEVAARHTLVVCARTTWPELPAIWPELSQEVWGSLRAGGVRAGCPNVMLYLDDVPNIEVGVVSSEAVSLAGAVRRSALPGGRVATATHRGGYAGLSHTHEAVLAWCREHGHEPTGTRWELYGPHRDDPDEVWVEVSWLLA